MPEFASWCHYKSDSRGEKAREIMSVADKLLKMSLFLTLKSAFAFPFPSRFRSVFCNASSFIGTEAGRSRYPAF
jgi:hypothetical protein